MSERNGEEPQSFGQRLRYLRSKRGLKQAELAALIGKPQSTISSYEADERSPTLDVVVQLALGLNSSVAVLVGEQPDLDVELEPVVWRRQLLELTGYLSQLSTVDFEELVIMLRLMAALKLDRGSHSKQPVRGVREKI